MVRTPRWSLILCVATMVSLTVGRSTWADEPAPEKPPASGPAAPSAFAATHESRMLLALLKATGRVTLRYLDEKQDPEKAAAYEDILRALGGVMTHLAPGDERAAVAAGMKAMLDLMPTMGTPKRSAVMRDVLATMAQAVAEGMAAAGTPARPATRPEGPAGRRALAHAVLGGIADGLFAEVSRRTLFGAQLAALRPGREGFPVTAVRAGSRAEQFGLRAGDTIVRIQGSSATWRTLLAATRALHRDGEFPPLTVLREGNSVELTPPPTPTPQADPR